MREKDMQGKYMYFRNFDFMKPLSSELTNFKSKSANKVPKYSKLRFRYVSPIH